MYIEKDFYLSDEGLEDAICGSQVPWHSIGIDLNWEATLDATTLLKFRRMLETQHLITIALHTYKLHLFQEGLLYKKTRYRCLAKNAE